MKQLFVKGVSCISMVESWHVKRWLIFSCFGLCNWTLLFSCIGAELAPQAGDVRSISTNASSLLASQSGAPSLPFPSKTITVIVPFPPGGTTDVLAREVLKKMQANFKVPLVVVNKDGASGTLGSELVSRSIGDPHVLLLTATHHVINPSLLKNMPYDTRKSFTPISLIASAPNVLIANSGVAINSVSELIRFAKEHPGALSFASSGVGGANHLSGELFKVMAGIDMQHIPYRGAAPALNDVIAGHVPFMFDGLATVSKHLSEGKIKAIAITTLKRSQLAPNLPTISESGISGFEVSSWFGLYGPAQLSSVALEKLSREVQFALNSSDVRDQFLKLGVTPGEMDAPTFAAFVDEEMKKWSQVINNAKIPRQ